MAIFKCKDCGKEVSDKAVACPGCGRMFTPEEKKAGVKKQRMVLWLLASLALISVLWGLLSELR